MEGVEWAGDILYRAVLQGLDLKQKLHDLGDGAKWIAEHMLCLRTSKHLCWIIQSYVIIFL